MDRLALLADCARHAWRVQLGDTDPIGLALTAGYVLVLALMVRAVFAPADRFSGPRDRQLWMLALAGFLMLAVNKQLDLQHIASDMGRCYSEARGWYDSRAGFQHLVARSLLALSALAALALALAFRKALAANIPLILGLSLLAAYVLLQMADILHLDARFGAVVDNIVLHRVIEAAALGTLAWAAWAKTRPLAFPRQTL